MFILLGATAAMADGSLKSVPVPPIAGLDRYVRDPQTLTVLGKSLFWDMQVGSDGHTACGTCHFHAGADHRARNQLSNPHAAFEPNHLLAPDDFPFRVFADPTNNQSAVLRDSSRRTGSAGIVRRTFSGLTGGSAEAGADSNGAPEFQLGGLSLRQVTTRNAASVINAAFNARNFRDGRASGIFTGRTPFGDSDQRANVLAVINGQLTPERVRLENSSLASQAVAPPVNPSEMSYEGRTWPELGRKLLAARPLAGQSIAPDDSLLGPYVNPNGRGMAPGYTYRTLVEAAFQPAYWNSTQTVDESGNAAASGFAVAEYNFPLFFGLAIQAYESTLLADDTPFDRFIAGDQGALTTQQKAGFLDFQTSAFCQFCHTGPELTRASASFLTNNGPVDTVVSGRNGSFQVLFADTGFLNTGVRPASEDSGLDGTDDFGLPFSIAKQQGANPLAIGAAFKVPGLRNVEFTGPYFHNGSQATLEQVIDFYTRGGDFPDSPGLAVEMLPLALDAGQRVEIVAFLKSLSDGRVRYERAPFDHPELCAPVGYPDTPVADPVNPAIAQDIWAGIPAVGAGGNAVPLQTFDELLRGVGSDGSRAHTLADACTIPGLSAP